MSTASENHPDNQFGVDLGVPPSEAVEWLATNQGSEYHLVGMLIPHRLKEPFRKHKFATGLGATVLSLSALGAAFNGDISMTPQLDNGETHASMREFKFQGDILAGTGTFTDTSSAQLTVRTAIDLPGPLPKMDKAAPDPESQMKATCIGQMQLIVPGSAIDSKVAGGKNDLKVDGSKVYIKTSLPAACVVKQDDDAEQNLYGTLNTFRDAFVGVAKVAHVNLNNTVPKLDEMRHTVDYSAAAAMANESMKATVDSCRKKPKIRTYIYKAATQGVSRVAAGLQHGSVDDYPTTLEHPDQIQWHYKDKIVKKLQSELADMDPQVQNFKFDKASCDTTQMQTVGEKAG